MNAARGEMLHQREKERQILSRHPFLVEREDEIAAAGVDEKIRVLNPLGDAFVREQFADVVTGKEGGKLLGHDIGVDGHASASRSVCSLPQPNPGLPEVWPIPILPEAGKPAADWARVGEGGDAMRRERRDTAPSPPTPPHKGEGSAQSLRLRCASNSSICRLAPAPR